MAIRPTISTKCDYMKSAQSFTFIATQEGPLRANKVLVISKQKFSILGLYHPKHS